jgi:hypothetical protein
VSELGDSTILQSSLLPRSCCEYVAIKQGMWAKRKAQIATSRKSAHRQSQLRSCLVLGREVGLRPKEPAIWGLTYLHNRCDRTRKERTNCGKDEPGPVEAVLRRPMSLKSPQDRARREDSKRGSRVGECKIIERSGGGCGGVDQLASRAAKLPPATTGVAGMDEAGTLFPQRRWAKKALGDRNRSNGLARQGSVCLAEDHHTFTLGRRPIDQQLIFAG